MHLGGLLSWAKIALVVQVHSVGDRVEASCGPQLFHHRKKLVLALKAALAVIARILRTLELRSGNNLQGDYLFLREGNCIGEMSPGKAGRISDDREHFLPQ